MTVSLAKRPMVSLRKIARVSLRKAYLTGIERADALDALETSGAIGAVHLASRWDRATLSHPEIAVREISGAYSDRDPQGASSAIERAQYRVLRENFSTLGEGPYWLEITAATRVTPALLGALWSIDAGEVLDCDYLAIERDEILRSAWDNYGWGELRDASEAALGDALDAAEREGEGEATDALDTALSALQDYDSIADAGIDAEEIENGSAEFSGLDALAETLAAQAAAVAGIEL